MDSRTLLLPLGSLNWLFLYNLFFFFFFLSFL
jgi:hypothetical protein